MLPPAQLFKDSRAITGVQGHGAQSSLTWGIPGSIWWRPEPELLWERSDRANHYWYMALQPIYPRQNCWTNRRRRVELWKPVTPLTTPLLQCSLFCALAVITGFLMVWCLGQVNVGLGFGLQSDGVQKIGIKRHPPLFKNPNRRRRYKCKIQFRYSRQPTTYNSFPLMEIHKTIRAIWKFTVCKIHLVFTGSV